MCRPGGGNLHAEQRAGPGPFETGESVERPQRQGQKQRPAHHGNGEGGGERETDAEQCQPGQPDPGVEAEVDERGLRPRRRG